MLSEQMLVEDQIQKDATDGAARILGLQAVVYPSPDIKLGQQWYSRALGCAPYFVSPDYVGFKLGGFEAGLRRTAEPGASGAWSYWRTLDIGAAHARLLDLGARAHTPVRDVGEGVWVATVLDPFGNVLGLIQQPGPVIQAQH